jgi:hypothetical protein
MVPAYIIDAEATKGGHGVPAVAGALGDLALNFTQVFFLRRSGLVGAATVRITFYLVWQVIYGLF